MSGKYVLRQSAAPRLVATHRLRDQIRAEGRTVVWLARQIGVSKSFLGHVVGGRRSIAESDARVLAALVRGDVRVLFDVPGVDESVPIAANGHGPLR